MTLNADQLAQYRGCFPENPCYRDCVEAAQSTIDEYPNDPELDAARTWAEGERWV